MPGSMPPSQAIGRFDVDARCIACGKCWTHAPAHFSRLESGLAGVQHQPETSEEATACRQAAAICPVSCIHERAPSPWVPIGPDLWGCREADLRTGGAISYLLVRPEGNVLVDTPAFSPAVIAGLEALGDLRWIVLSHPDTIAEAEDFLAHFGATALLHRHEAEALDWPVSECLDGDAALAPDLELWHTPGHAPGSISLIWRRDETWVFPGDTLGVEAGESPGPIREEETDDWEAQQASASRLIAAGTRFFPARAPQLKAWKL